ncbi:MICOS complex subunit MIC26-like [Eucyclogobius newberryi]|uniref:MICOS complex subunit MIC26-like n=1 Tax=Eucyclogobius newberryi TaxID=166745 RepID=UPI003B5B2832
MARADHVVKVTGSNIHKPEPKMRLVSGPCPLPVLSAAGTDETEPVSPLHRDELSLYTAPEPNGHFIQPEPGQIEEAVATVRRWVEPSVSWCRGTFGQIKPRVQRGLRAGKEAYAFLSDPPKDFYPKAGVVGFTGILGLFLARGSRVKRLAYPAALMTVSASMYYPERAAHIAKTTGDRVYGGAVQGYAAAEKMFRRGPAEKKTVKGEEP